MNSTNALFSKSYKWMQLGISKWYGEMIRYSCRSRRRTHWRLNCGNNDEDGVSRIRVHARLWLMHDTFGTQRGIYQISVLASARATTYMPIRMSISLFTISILIFIMFKFNVWQRLWRWRRLQWRYGGGTQTTRTYRKPYKSNLIFRNDFKSLCAINEA